MTVTSAGGARPARHRLVPAGGRQRLHPARRLLTHPRLMQYNRLAAAVLALNLAILLHHLWRGDWLLRDGSAAPALSTLVLVNFAVAVLIRQQHVWNALLVLASAAPRS